MRLSHLLLILCLEQQFFVFQLFIKIIKKKNNGSSIFTMQSIHYLIGTLVYKRLVVDR